MKNILMCVFLILQLRLQQQIKREKKRIEQTAEDAKVLFVMSEQDHVRARSRK